MTKENIYNDLYERAKNSEHFTNLMPLVFSKENILLAYRNIKNNTGSHTAGTDGMTIDDIKKMTAEEVVDKVKYMVSGTKRGYRPKAARIVKSSATE
jgi:retron-type reverse transcriptase